MASRYVKKEDREKTDRESGFRCAWCGVMLIERHHIEEYSAGGSNTANNLILLCPNCHTELHQGRIDKDELETRKKELCGVVNRESGSLSIQGEPVFVAGGTRYIGLERIVVHNNTDYLRIEHDGETLLIYLRLYDRMGRLICWMSRNRWWVENDAIFDFTRRKNEFQIDCKEIGCVFRVDINSEIVNLRARMYIEGRIVEFTESTLNLTNVMGGGIIAHIGTVYGVKDTIAIKV